jgi:hypothetical protein
VDLKVYINISEKHTASIFTVVLKMEAICSFETFIALKMEAICAFETLSALEMEP